MDRLVIYDIGANVGLNIPYYLLKADLVIAVEANPVMVGAMTQKYKQDILRGHLIIVGFSVCAERGSSTANFFVHKANPLLSQFPEPKEKIRSQFTKIEVQSIGIIELIEQYGQPYYVKLDAEGYDAELLRAMFTHDIRPPFISAECHEAKVFATMLATGGYGSFKIIDGARVSAEYAHHSIETKEGHQVYSFPEHSAGPFGDDIKGPWLNENAALLHLARVGLGWTDVHATTMRLPSARSGPTLDQEVRGLVRRALKARDRQ